MSLLNGKNKVVNCLLLILGCFRHIALLLFVTTLMLVAIHMHLTDITSRVAKSNSCCRSNAVIGVGSAWPVLEPQPNKLTINQKIRVHAGQLNKLSKIRRLAQVIVQ